MWKKYNDKLYLERYIKEKARWTWETFGYCYMNYLWNHVEPAFQDSRGFIKQDRLISFDNYFIQKNIKISTIEYLKL